MSKKINIKISFTQSVGGVYSITFQFSNKLKIVTYIPYIYGRKQENVQV